MVHTEGWDPQAAYAVRAVDGDVNWSTWTLAVRLASEPASAHALGGLFPVRGREGWCADTTFDGFTFDFDEIGGISEARDLRYPKSRRPDDGATAATDRNQPE